MGPIQSFEDLIGLIRRRFWLMAIVAILGTAFAIYYAKSRPDVYQTAAVLQVEMPMVADGQGGGNSMLVLQNIEQRLTTRDNLIALIERHKLFADQPALTLEDQVWAMRASIQIQSITGPTGALSAIIVSAQSGSAENAARIANDLAQSVLDMGAQSRKAGADASVAFYRDQASRLWQQITRLEAEIAAYRESNRAALPGVSEARQDEILQLDSALRELDLEMSGLQSEISSIQAQNVQRGTDQRRLEFVTRRMEVLTAQRLPLAQRKDGLVSSLGDTAEVERILSAYDRQLRQYQDQYTAASNRMAEAETAQSLADRQQTERFALLERAITPDYPMGAGGKKLVIAGAIGSAALGFILALVLDLMRPALRTSQQMERELGIRPVVAIPNATMNARKKKLPQSIQSLARNEAGFLSKPSLSRSQALLLGLGAIIMLGIFSLL